MRRQLLVAFAGLAAAFAGWPACTIAAGAATQCHFANGIEHVVYIQFDNVHLRRDDPHVPSDLEQIPNLLNFLRGQGTVFTNHHTPLISHTAVDIVTSLTGVYGDKFGVPIGNSFGLFENGVAKDFPQGGGRPARRCSLSPRTGRSGRSDWIMARPRSDPGRRLHNNQALPSPALACKSPSAAPSSKFIFLAAVRPRSSCRAQ